MLQTSEDSPCSALRDRPVSIRCGELTRTRGRTLNSERHRNLQILGACATNSEHIPSQLKQCKSSASKIDAVNTTCRCQAASAICLSFLRPRTDCLLAAAQPDRMTPYRSIQPRKRYKTDTAVSVHHSSFYVWRTAKNTWPNSEFRRAR